MDTKRIFIITGEASGDLHGAHLAEALREADSSVSILGVGGRHMQAAGVQLLQDIPQLDLVGLAGPRVLRAAARRIVAIRRVLKEAPLDLVVLIDHPGLNFHFARVAKQAGRTIVYYITPQLWAWRPGRMTWMQRRVDHALLILPFEEALYRRAGVPCTFVGHPLLDSMTPSYDRDRVRAGFSLPREGPVLGLLPGSRPHEVRALLPLMLEAARTLQQRRGSLRLILAVADTVSHEEIKGLCEGAALDVRLIAGDPNGVMAASDLVFAASGTASLQAAIIGTPMVIVYKVSWLVYLIARLLTSTPASLAARRICWPTMPTIRCMGLPNLIAGRPFIPELLQRLLTSERLAEQGRRILDDAGYRQAMRAEMGHIRSRLGASGASKRAAAVILDMLKRQEARA